MRNGLLIVDAGPIFSLATIDKLEILNILFDDIKIPSAVWEEITLNKNTKQYSIIHSFFKNKRHEIKGNNDLTFLMDYGESESVLLYKELKADFLLIDDKKARTIAENFGIKCIGTIGFLSAAKDKKIILELKPLFENLLQNRRFFSINLLNTILEQHNEEKINYKA